jgi:PhoH-like ATPase
MPLPPAPTKRAALLAPEAYSLKSSDDAFDGAASFQPDPPTALRVDSPAPAPVKTSIEPTKPATRPRKTDTASPVKRATVAAPQPATTRVDLAAPRLPLPTPAPATLAPHAGARRRGGKAAAHGATRLFVLDTNVLLHDPMSLFRFEEHDIYLPMIVLEELDGHKKGMTEVARNGRQTTWRKGSSFQRQGTRPRGVCSFSRPSR